MAFTRRVLLQASTLSFLRAAVAHARPSPVAQRIVALDWASAETLVSLGVIPVAMTEQDRFVGAYPQYPEAAQIQDLGPPWEPNLELIDSLSPAIIYTSNYTKLVEPQLRDIAEVVVSDLHAGRLDQVERCIAFASSLVNRYPETLTRERYSGMIATWEQCRGVLAKAGASPVLCLFLHSNGRFANAFGRNSFAGNVLEHVGLNNAWQKPTNNNGFDYVGIEALTTVENSRIIVLGNGIATARALQRLADNALWQAIPAVRKKNVRVFPDIAMYGALPTAVRFASMLRVEFGDA